MKVPLPYLLQKKLNGSLLSLVLVNIVLLFPQLKRAGHGAAKVVVAEAGHMVRDNTNGGSGDGVRGDCRCGVQVSSLCHLGDSYLKAPVLSCHTEM